MLYRVLPRPSRIFYLPRSHFAKPKKKFSKDVDYYSLLNVKRTATLPEIKKGFYELSKKHHPDLNINHNKAKYMEVKEAYEILSNSELRKQYDAFIKDSSHSQADSHRTSHEEEEDHSGTGPYQSHEEYNQYAQKPYSHHTKAEWFNVRMGVRPQSYVEYSSGEFEKKGAYGEDEMEHYNQVKIRKAEIKEKYFQKEKPINPQIIKYEFDSLKKKHQQRLNKVRQKLKIQDEIKFNKTLTGRIINKLKSLLGFRSRTQTVPQKDHKKQSTN